MRLFSDRTNFGEVRSDETEGPLETEFGSASAVSEVRSETANPSEIAPFCGAGQSTVEFALA